MYVIRRFYSASSKPASQGACGTPHGALVAHESVPSDMGSEAFLIPGADLVLHEQIGAGAEGKVSLRRLVGAWLNGCARLCGLLHAVWLSQLPGSLCKLQDMSDMVGPAHAVPLSTQLLASLCNPDGAVNVILLQVYRGRWNHTVVAVKQYLAQMPHPDIGAASAGSSALTAQAQVCNWQKSLLSLLPTFYQRAQASYCVGCCGGAALTVGHHTRVEMQASSNTVFHTTPVPVA